MVTDTPGRSNERQAPTGEEPRGTETHGRGAETLGAEIAGAALAVQAWHELHHNTFHTGLAKGDGGGPALPGPGAIRAAESFVLDPSASQTDRAATLARLSQSGIRNFDHNGQHYVIESQPGTDGSRQLTLLRENGGQRESIFDTRVDRDGRTEGQDAPREVAAHPSIQAGTVEQERTRLQQQAERHITNPEQRRQFRQNMEAFERRAQQSGMPQEEIARTYSELSRMMEAPAGQVSLQNRALALRGFMHHVANPSNVDQGAHDTCSVTTLTERNLTRNPSLLANMMASAAVDGRWTAPDGRVITLTPQSLVPGAEERRMPPRDGQRSFATQLMSVTMANDITQRRHPPEFYSQERPQGKQDTGERLRYADGSPVMTRDDRGRLVRATDPNINLDDMQRFQTRLTGERNTVVGHSSEAAAFGNNFIGVSSAAELGQAIRQAQQDRRMPLIVGVDGNNRIFGGSGREEGPHVITITDFDPATGRVRISNQWGRRSDRWMTLEQLYRTVEPVPPRPRR